MHEGNVYLGPNALPGSHFQSSYIDRGVAYDPLTIGGTTAFMERSAEGAAAWRTQQAQNNTPDSFQIELGVCH